MSGILNVSAPDSPQLWGEEAKAAGGEGGRGRLHGPAPWVDSMVLSLLVAAASLLAYPMYENPWFFIAVGVGVVVGNLVAYLAVRKAWSALKTVAVTFGVYLLLGVPVAAPTVFQAPETIPGRFLQVLLAPVAAWKQVLSLKLPLGVYHAVLAPVFLLALVFTVLSLNLAWRRGRQWPLAPVAATLPMFFGLVFGARTTYIGGEDTWFQWGVGTAIFALAFGWFVWRPLATYRRRVTAARRSLGMEIRGRWIAMRLSRFVLGVLMVAVALATSFWLAPTAMEGHTSRGLREQIDPLQQVAHQQSPLATYRKFFADENFEEPLFEVVNFTGLERVRLATMPDYDGHQFSVAGGGEGGTAGEFLRLPASLPPSVHGLEAEDSDLVNAVVEVAGYRGVWVPIPGGLSDISFGGVRESELDDSFYFDRDSDTGLSLVEGGLAEGDRYSVGAYPYLLPAEAIETFTPSKPSGSTAVAATEFLEQWVEMQDVGEGGPALVELVSLLRSRGYLSHGLLESEAKGTKWFQQLRSSADSYGFARSSSGHSLGRVDGLFASLVEKQVGLPEDADPGEFVAAVGDDEQFAVAAYLLADRMGFNARIVLGARLVAPVEDEDDLPICEQGVCRGQDMAVWLEVQDGQTGRWAAIDVTPQFKLAPASTQQKSVPPKHSTDVPEDNVVALPPPQPKPTDTQAQLGPETPDDSTGLVLAEGLRYWGAGFLVLWLLLVPFLIVFGVKALRRRRRKRNPDKVTSSVAAWDDYLDYATDLGFSVDRDATRLEQLEEVVPTDAAARKTAELSDLAAFGWLNTNELDSEEVWKQSDEARKNLGERYGSMRRIGALLSLRSFRSKNKRKQTKELDK